jgi:hypothetical protein
MQVITEDPNDTIPNINESMFRDKMLIAVLNESNLGTFIGQVMYDGGNYFFGGNNREGNGFGEWSISRSVSIIQLISKLWDQYKQYYEIKVYIIDNWQELAQVIQEASQCPN